MVLTEAWPDYIEQRFKDFVRIIHERSRVRS
jgi:hypothetical protein